MAGITVIGKDRPDIPVEIGGCGNRHQPRHAVGLCTRQKQRLPPAHGRAHDHLRPGGIVAFHVSNRFLELVPVVARLASENGAHAVLVDDDPDEDDATRSTSDWVLVSRDPAALGHEEIAAAGAVPAEDRPEWRTWTDDYSNLVQILK